MGCLLHGPRGVLEIANRDISELGWLLIGIALLIYDEIIGAARYDYCYPYPIFGRIGDVYVASAVPFSMIIAGGLLLRYGRKS